MPLHTRIWVWLQVDKDAKAISRPFRRQQCPATFEPSAFYVGDPAITRPCDCLTACSCIYLCPDCASPLVLSQKCYASSPCLVTARYSGASCEPSVPSASVTWRPPSFATPYRLVSTSDDQLPTPGNCSLSYSPQAGMERTTVIAQVSVHGRCVDEFVPIVFGMRRVCGPCRKWGVQLRY